MILRMIAILLILVPVVFVIPWLVTNIYARGRMFSVETAPFQRVAVVFGAGLWRDGRPTPVLRDRVATAASLYFAGKVEKLLMSGDNRFDNYNEPGAMRDYAIQLGVPAEAIVMDFAGRRTYDTCYRAREIFGADSVVLVSQRFHIPRALYTCKVLQVSAIGVPADLRQYRQRSLFFWNMREFPATLVALWELHVSRPLPVLGNPEPIFPTEAQ